MILKRQEKDDTIKAMYDSSNILASTFNKATNDLIIIFKGGKQYKYPNVLATDYTRFELAESQGKVFNSHIKKYTFEKLEDINEGKLLTEIVNAKLKEQEEGLNSIKEKLLTEITSVQTSITENSDISDVIIMSLNESIVEYKKRYAAMKETVTNE